jgi:hypothetical protein
LPLPTSTQVISQLVVLANKGQLELIISSRSRGHRCSAVVDAESRVDAEGGGSRRAYLLSPRAPSPQFLSIIDNVFCQAETGNAAQIKTLVVSRQKRPRTKVNKAEVKVPGASNPTTGLRLLP